MWRCDTHNNNKSLQQNDDAPLQHRWSERASEWGGMKGRMGHIIIYSMIVIIIIHHHHHHGQREIEREREGVNVHARSVHTACMCYLKSRNVNANAMYITSTRLLKPTSRQLLNHHHHSQLTTVHTHTHTHTMKLNRLYNPFVCMLYGTSQQQQ